MQLVERPDESSLMLCERVVKCLLHLYLFKTEHPLARVVRYCKTMPNEKLPVESLLRLPNSTGAITCESDASESCDSNASDSQTIIWSSFDSPREIRLPDWSEQQTRLRRVFTWIAGRNLCTWGLDLETRGSSMELVYKKQGLGIFAIPVFLSELESQ